MPRVRSLTAVVLILIGLLSIGGYSHFVSAHPRVLSSVRAGEVPLRIVTFNTSVVNADTNAISQELRRLDADVAVLMEFSEKKYPVIEISRAKYPHFAGCVRRRHCHFAVLSKFPILSAEVREGWDGPLMVKVTLGGALGSLNVIGVHFPRLPYVRSQFAERKVLLEFLEQLKGPRIVVGDFNATGFSKLISEFASRANMKRLTGLPTWPVYGQLPQFGIDHIFVSPDIRQLENAHIGRSSGSDHFPVMVRLAVPLLVWGGSPSLR
ncbi:MAG TPA: endonuclease/exonuclease/phosphatase family protein [Candidatus Saccharimonadales bacterium]|nr:endonuclease/exonuclease/phosphatase family protein [Candidatus Saccharimonadales bacterium]